MRRTERFGLRAISGVKKRKTLAFGSAFAAVALVLMAALVGSVPAVAASTGCPSLDGRLASPDVLASKSDNGTGTETYSISTPSSSSVGGVPGLIEYCVFTAPAPDTSAASITGWDTNIDSSGVSFSRPDGNPSNLPFDGSTVVVGSATWGDGSTGTVPADQVILLHINDPAECDALYGGNPGTCWVFPGPGETRQGLDTSVATQIHLGTDGESATVVGGDTHVPFQSTVHDSATVTASDSESIPAGSVDFFFFTNADCSGGPGTAAGHVSLDSSGVAHPSDSEGPLAAGSYSFQAFFVSSDEGAFKSSAGPCEPLTVDADTTTTVGTTTTVVTTTESSTPQNPPPPGDQPTAVVTKTIDLVITKAAAPSPVSLGAQVTWTLVVHNNGPSDATGVKTADALPAGMTFVSATTTQGTCSGTQLVSCDLGNLANGASATIVIKTTAAAAGSVVNTATVVGNEAETNTANNAATAPAVVRGALKPPAVVACTAVAVSPKSIFVGRPVTLTLKVSQGGKPAAGIHVRLKGSLGLVTKKTNKQGIVRTKVQAKKAGIVSFAPVAHKKCASPRIGAVGVFTPPLTG